MTDPKRVTEYIAANCSTVLAGGNDITGWMEWEDFGVLMGTYFILCFASHYVCRQHRLWLLLGPRSLIDCGHRKACHLQFSADLQEIGITT
jgi:hypothetical protein